MAVSTLFDGTDDRIVSTTGNNLTLGAYTWGALLHLETIAGLDTWFSLDDGATARFAPFTSGTTIGVEHATGTSATLANAFADWGGWRLVFITKATGTAAPRSHIYNGVSWVHANLGTAIGNPNGAIDELWIGGYANAASDFSDGEVGWMGLWNEDTNDATCETYVNYTTLSGKSNAQFFTGTSLLAGGTMADSSGVGNSETSRTGATTGVRHLPAWQTNFHTRSLPGVTSTSEYVGTTGNPTEARPTGATTGDLIIAVVGTDTNSTIAWSSGWTEIYNTANGTATRLGVAARVLTGGGDDTLAITLAGGSNTNDFACQEHCIPAALHGVSNPATDIALGTVATGSDAAPNPPSVSVSSGDYYIMCMFAADDDDTSNAFMPASYAGLRQTRSTTGTSSCMVATAFAERTGITSENPGTFTMAASEEWVAGTIAIPPADAATDVPAAVVSTPVSVPAPTITASATVEPALVATPVAVPTATVNIAAVPATVATPVGIPAATITTTATPTPAVVTTSCGVPAPTITATATVEPATVATPATIPAATVVTAITPTPAAVATPVTIPAATVTATSTVEPAVVPTPVSVPAATITATASVEPAVVATPVAIPGVTITASATVTPLAVPTPVVIPTAVVDTAGNATPAPATVATPVAVLAATITATATVSGTVVATPVSVPAATVTASATIPVGLVQTPIALPAPTVTASANVSAALVALVITVYVATIDVEGSGPATTLRRALLVHRQPAVIVQRRPGIVEHQQPTTVVHRQPRANVHRRPPIT